MPKLNTFHIECHANGALLTNVDVKRKIIQGWVEVTPEVECMDIASAAGVSGALGG